MLPKRQTEGILRIHIHNVDRQNNITETYNVK
jgi:hypothetical protein